MSSHIARRALGRRPLVLPSCETHRACSIIFVGASAPLAQQSRSLSEAHHASRKIQRHDIRSSAPRIRHFSTSSVFLKKGGKDKRSTPAAAGPSSSNEDPLDITALQTNITEILESLKSSLSKLRSGGRFNPDTVSSLRVQISKSDPKTYPLSDLAQVIPKGRNLEILVSEKDYVKPVSSSIQGSKLNLTPRPDPTGKNELLLVAQIPTATAESRAEVVKEAGKMGDKALGDMRNARGVQQKKFRTLEKEKSVRPDDLKKAMAGMEKVVERETGECKKIVEGAKKALDQ